MDLVKTIISVSLIAATLQAAKAFEAMPTYPTKPVVVLRSVEGEPRALLLPIQHIHYFGDCGLNNPSYCTSVHPYLQP